MQKQWTRWLVILALTVLVAVAASKFDRFPGDVAITGFVQSLGGDNVGWAQKVTNTVSDPWKYILLAISVVVSWRLAGWRGAAIAIISLGGMLLVEPYIKPMIARPRPSPSLVRVTGSPSGYSFPSGFAVIYFAIFGYLSVLAWQRLTGRLRWRVVLICCLFLVVGGCARVALGAHWPSDIAGAYLIGLTWVLLLLNLDRYIGSRSRTVPVREK